MALLKPTKITDDNLAPYKETEFDKIEREFYSLPSDERRQFIITMVEKGMSRYLAYKHEEIKLPKINNDESR